MRQLIEDLISMMEYHVEQTRPIHTTTVALQAAREALKSLSAQPAPVQSAERGEPVDTLIAAWQALEETSGHVLDVGDVEGRMHISVIRSAWEQMDSLVREIWDERGRP